MATISQEKKQDQGKSFSPHFGEDAKRFGEKAGEEAKRFADKAGDEAQRLGEKAGEKAQELTEKAGSIVGTATEKVKEAAHYLGDKADQATGAVGEGIETVGEKVREMSPKSGILGHAGEALAEKLEGSGKYLEEQGLTGMAEDVTLLIRRNPIPAVLIGIGIGFCLARLTRS